jgi:hypothetical protein
MSGADRDIDVDELARMRADGTAHVLLDVREPDEVAICALSDSVEIPMQRVPNHLRKWRKWVRVDFDLLGRVLRGPSSEIHSDPFCLRLLSPALNKKKAMLQDRMLMILDDADLLAWLRESTTPSEVVAALMRPCSSWPWSRSIRARQNQGAEFCQPIAAPA